MTAHAPAEHQALAVAASAAPHLSDAQRIAHAEARLARSRETLLRDDAPPGTRPAAFDPGVGWFVRLAGRSLRRWWRHHPLVVAGSAVAGDLQAHLKPLAHKHPWAVVGAAALGGAALMWLAPRRLSLAVVPWAVREVNVLVRTLILTLFTRP